MSPRLQINIFKVQLVVLRLWTRALTGAEIYYNYNKTLTPANETGLVVNCNFSEGSGTIVDNDATADKT